MSPIKLNIGAGSTVIPGFTAIDRKLGSEAYPLPYPDGSISEIRASHILEHFTFGEAQTAMQEWTRVLKPGGRYVFSEPFGENPILEFIRKRIPYPGKHRSPDEKPLNHKDITLFQKRFINNRIIPNNPITFRIN